MANKIRVLIVDDSMLFRELLLQRLSSDPQIEIVATAKDPYDARDKIIEFEPDVMTCDVEMPRMNGIEFIRKLMPQYPLPIIVVSSTSGTVFDAMNAGAVDFVAKPNLASANSVENFITDLINKIKIAVNARVQNTAEGLPAKIKDVSSSPDDRRVIAIGASTGGTEALTNILKKLPADVPGIVVVQHIPPVFSKMFADRLNHITDLNVKEASTGDWIERGRVLIAPGDKHMIVKKSGNKYKVECFTDEKVNGHCPSVDVLFESIAKSAGNNAIGVILTGMGYDGAKGLMSMRRRGARTIGQDEKSCVVYGMPKVAYNIGAVEKQVHLDHIAHTLYSLSCEK